MNLKYEDCQVGRKFWRKERHDQFWIIRELKPSTLAIRYAYQDRDEQTHFTVVSRMDSDLEWAEPATAAVALKSTAASGAFCTGRCGEFYPYAQPADLAAFKCFGCKC